MSTLKIVAIRAERIHMQIGPIYGGVGIPKIRHIPMQVPRLIFRCLGTGDLARVRGLIQTSCFPP